MAKIIFILNGIQTVIQCDIQDKMNNLFKKFASKLNIDINDYIFIYGGNRIDKDLTFEQLANSIDIKANQMNILVYELNNLQESNEKIEKIDINDLKEKIKNILSIYLEDRIYLNNKVENWGDAILKECESIFKKFTDYITFLNLIIHDKSIKESRSKWSSSIRREDYDFGVELKNDKIYGYIKIIMFNKNKENNKKDLEKALKEIETQFLNLAEGREYDVFQTKYKDIFKSKLEKENLPNRHFYFFDFFNKYCKGIMKSIIINKNNNEEKDYLLSKIINGGEIYLYLALGGI